MNFPRGTTIHAVMPDGVSHQLGDHPERELGRIAMAAASDAQVASLASLVRGIFGHHILGVTFETLRLNGTTTCPPASWYRNGKMTPSAALATSLSEICAFASVAMHSEPDSTTESFLQLARLVLGQMLDREPTRAFPEMALLQGALASRFTPHARRMADLAATLVGGAEMWGPEWTLNAEPVFRDVPRSSIAELVAECGLPPVSDDWGPGARRVIGLI